MKRTRLVQMSIHKTAYIVASAIAATLLITFIYGSDRLKADDDALRLLMQADNVLPLEVIIEKAKDIQQGRLLEVEVYLRQGEFLYEVEILDNRGRVWELYFDAKSGDLVEYKDLADGEEDE